MLLRRKELLPAEDAAVVAFLVLQDFLEVVMAGRASFRSLSTFVIFDMITSKEDT